MPDILPMLLPPFKNASILVVGDIMLDRYWFGEASRISPEAPVPIVNVKSQEHRPGGAANVALNLGALGTQAIILGITGEDEAAKIIQEQLRAAAVTPYFCSTPNLSTPIKLRVISQRQQLIRLDFEETTPKHHPNFLEEYKKQLTKVTLVILSDYKKGTLADPQTLIQLAHQAKVKVLIDPKGDFSHYQYADIITPNFKEFEAVMGACPDEQTIIEKGQALLTHFNINVLVLTRGEQGITLIQKNSPTHHFPAFAREVVDVTGAGDTVIATLGAAVAAGTDMITAVALSNLAASVAVTKLGAVNVSAPELQAALNNKILSSGIVNEEQLHRAITSLKASGKKIVFTNGCFDILHPAHITYLELAKSLGDFLIVAVNADESVQKLKGPHRPINHLEHRMKVLAGLNVVDWVIPFADATPERLLNYLQPDILAKGNDYTLDQVVGKNIVEGYGGEVKIIESNQGNDTITSSRIIKKIQSLKDDYE